MSKCRDCRYWDTAKRQGFMAPCTLHNLPFGTEFGECHGEYDTNYRDIWMPDLGVCSGFTERVALQYWMRIKPVKSYKARPVAYKPVTAIKIIREMGETNLASAKRWFENAIENSYKRGDRQVALVLKDFAGFRRALAECGYEVDSAPAPLEKKRKKST